MELEKFSQEKLGNTKEWTRKKLWKKKFKNKKVSVESFETKLATKYYVDCYWELGWGIESWVKLGETIKNR